MPFNLLLLPLLGGYFFTHFTYRTRFRAYGHAQYRLLLEAALFGFVFVCISHAATRSLIAVPAAQPYIASWKAIAPFQYSGSAFGSLLVALGATGLANWFWGASKSSEITVNRYGDNVMRLLHRAQKESKTIMLTLTDRKVYVGFVHLDRNLKPTMPYVSILPTASGYRQQDTLRVHLTVSYGPVYEEIMYGNRDDVEIEDFTVVVPTSLIASVRVFSIDVYQDHFGDSSGESDPPMPEPDHPPAA